MKNAKQLLRNVALPAILIFSLTNCNEAKKEKPHQEEEEPKEIDAPKNIISIKEASAIFDNYTNFRVPAIVKFETQQRAPSEKFEAARFVDFDYQMIKDYIAYVDKEAEDAGVKKVTKLRMYFANYPNEIKFKDNKDVVHPRQNSIFLLPTMDADGGNFGFYIGDDGKAKLIKDKTTDLNEGSDKSEASLLPSFNSMFYSDKSLILNRGNSGPPPFGDF